MARKRRSKLPPGVRKRGRNYEVFYRAPDGRQVQESVGPELRAAVTHRKQQMDAVAAGTWRDPRLARLTFERWGKQWIKARREQRKPPATVGDDESRLRDHLTPELGDLVLEDLDVRHIEELIEVLHEKVSEATGERLSRNTIANVWGTLTKCLADAEKELKRQGVPWVNPVDVLDDSKKPKRVKRPRGYYRRDELEALISDPRIALDRRAFWALLFLTGMRHDEAAGLRWGDIDRSATPLPKIDLHEQAGGRPLKEDRHDQGLRRAIPLHPVLGVVLERWRSQGWPDAFGRHPKDEDYVVPPLLDVKRWRPKRTTLKQLKRDSELVGAKVRTTHETRNSFLTLCSEDSPELEHIVKLITHQPVGGAASETYMRTRWLAKCRAISAFDVRLDRRAEVVSIPRAVGADADVSADIGQTEAKSPCNAGASGGADGTRTRGLRRDRPAL